MEWSRKLGYFGRKPLIQFLRMISGNSKLTMLDKSRSNRGWVAEYLWKIHWVEKKAQSHGDHMRFASSHAVDAIQLGPLSPAPAFGRIETRPVGSCAWQMGPVKQASCSFGVGTESLTAELLTWKLAGAQDHTECLSMA